MAFLPRTRYGTEEPIELEALAHEDGLHRLLEQVLEVPLVGVDGEVVDGGVGGGVEHAALHHVVVVEGLLGVPEQGLEAGLGDDPEGEVREAAQAAAGLQVGENPALHAVVG